jgi:NDP-sugar pyrophosphorylase family protein
VISNIDLGAMLDFQRKYRPLATLAVQKRESSRHLLFDEDMRLCGRRAGRDQDEVVGKKAPAEALAFSGIHVISPRIFPLMQEEGVFSIIDCYLRLARQGESILGFRADRYHWRDLGRADDLRKASADLSTAPVVD